jgi:plastocyanin
VARRNVLLPWGCDLKRVLLTAVIATLAYASVAGAAATQIKVADNFFSPRTPPVRNLASGASFTWTRASGSVNAHNVRQDFSLFRSGDVTSGPINYSVSASAGTYHYYCELHRDLGMDGVVKVRPTFLADPAGAPFTVRWALLGTTTGNKFDVRFRVGTTTTWRLWKNDTSARSGVFGQNGQPVQVVTGRTYQFQVRSENDPTKPSGWSPALTVNT